MVPIIKKKLKEIGYSENFNIEIVNAKKNKTNEAFVLLKKRENVSKDIYYLSKTNNLNEAAKNLYSVLRKIKKDKYKSIAVEKIPNEGIGKTINDRLKRASNFK